MENDIINIEENSAKEFIREEENKSKMIEEVIEKKIKPIISEKNEKLTKDDSRILRF